MEPTRIIYHFYNLFLTIPWVLLIRKYLTPRRGLLGKPIVHYLLFELMIYSSSWVYGFFAFKIAWFIFLIFLILCLSFSDSIGKKLFTATALHMIALISESLSVILINLAIGKPISSLTASADIYALTAIISVTIAFGIAGLLGAILSKNAFRLSQKEFLLYAILPLSQAVTLFTFVHLLMYESFEPLKFWEVMALLFFTGIFILVSALMLKTLQNAEKSATILAQNQFLLRERQLLMQHNEAVLLQQDRVRKIRHDLNNHIQTLQALLLKGSGQDAQCYAQDMRASYTDHLAYRICDNEIVDIVLQNMLERTKHRGIILDIDVDLGRNLAMDDLDLTCVFSNLADNAIEACQLDVQIKEKRIHVWARDEDGRLELRIVNTKMPGALDKREIKSEAIPHGLGISIVREIAAKYSGTLMSYDHGNSYEVQFALGTRREAAAAKVSVQSDPGLQHKQKPGFSGRDALKYALLPISQGATLYFFATLLLFDQSHSATTRDVLLLMFFVILYAIVNGVILRSLRRISIATKTAEENRWLQEEHSLQMRHNESLLEQQRAVYILRRDIYEQVNAIQQLLSERSNSPKALEYLQQLRNQYDHVSNIDFCRHKIIDAVLFDKSQIARKKGIELVVNIIADNSLKVDNWDVLYIFSAMIDYAIEVCEHKKEQKLIEITASQNKGFFAVKVTAFVDASIGIGGLNMHLHAVKDIAEQNHGSFEVMRGENALSVIVTLEEAQYEASQASS